MPQHTTILDAAPLKHEDVRPSEIGAEGYKSINLPPSSSHLEDDRPSSTSERPLPRRIAPYCASAAGAVVASPISPTRRRPRHGIVTIPSIRRQRRRPATVNAGRIVLRPPVRNACEGANRRHGRDGDGNEREEEGVGEAAEEGEGGRRGRGRRRPRLAVAVIQ